MGPDWEASTVLPEILNSNGGKAFLINVKFTVTNIGKKPITNPFVFGRISLTSSNLLTDFCGDSVYTFWTRTAPGDNPTYWWKE